VWNHRPRRRRQRPRAAADRVGKPRVPGLRLGGRRRPERLRHQRRKRSGKVKELKESIGEPLDGEVGIGHTRWSTHGPPTDANAHPHTDESEDVAVVHNGIIENYVELRERLAENGYVFTSDTDTEVIPHLVQYYLDAGFDSESAFRQAIDELEGSYAVTAMVTGQHVLYAARQGSPLVVGMEDGEYFLASDVPAFLDGYTDSVVYLEDGDVVIVDDDGVEFTDLKGNPIVRTSETVEWDPEQAGKGEYDHFMLKEINEQPTSLTQALEGRIDSLNGRIFALRFRTGNVRRCRQRPVRRLRHLVSRRPLRLARAEPGGVHSIALLANEYSVSAPPIDDDTLVIAVTQSGETADTLNALRQAAAEGARTLTVTNVVGSTAAREADDTLFIRAGPEIGVAATKTFSSQAVMLTLLGQRIADDVRGDPRPTSSRCCRRSNRCPPKSTTSSSTRAPRRSPIKYSGSEAYFFIGRGLGFPVALEGALKFKEITYEHAEGFASGELKHGPLALVTPQTPVFAIFTGQEDEKTLKNAEEAQTRGAPVIAVCPDGHPAVEGGRRTPADSRHRSRSGGAGRERSAPARLLSRRRPARPADRQTTKPRQERYRRVTQHSRLRLRRD